MAKDKKKLSEELYRWTIDEMHYYPLGRHANTKLPTPDDMQMICRGQLIDIWKYVIANVRSSQTVATVKGNLSLRSKHDLVTKSEPRSEERRRMEEERSALRDELTKLQSEINHVDKDVCRLENDIEKSDCLLREAASSYHDTMRKAAILKTYSKMCGERIAQNEELANRLKAKFQHLTSNKRQHSSEEAYFSRDNRGEKRGTSDVETECCRDVRLACESIETFLQTIVNPSPDTEKEAIRTQKGLLWTQVEEVGGKYTADQIIQALVTNTQECTYVLQEKTAAIDIKADAEKLRFKYEGRGTLTDVSQPPNVLKGVRQLLEASQAGHVKKFFNTEKNLNAAYKLEREIEMCKGKIDRALLSIKQPGERDLAKTLIDMSLELAQESTALSVLNEQKVELQLSVRKASHAQEKLLLKHEKIADFRQLADKKQDLIHVLARNNSKSPSRLEDQKNDIQNYVAGTLLCNDTHTETLIHQHQNHVTREVDRFMTLNLPYLLHTTIDGNRKLAALDLSINHSTRPNKTEAGDVLQQISRIVDVPYYKASECLFKACVELKSKIDDHTQRVECNRKKLASTSHIAEKTLGKNDIKELCETVQKHDKHQLDELQPLLTGRINKTANAIGNCLSATESTRNWWEQPGQYCVPWVKVKGHTLPQWLDQWTVLATQIRQLQISSESQTFSD